MVNPIIVKLFGGRTVIDGVQVTDEDHDMIPLTAGEDVILILVYNKKDGKYELPGIAGAFSIQQGTLIPLLKAAPEYERFRGMGVAQFEAEIHQRGR
jgi:hypothetical protein